MRTTTVLAGLAFLFVWRGGSNDVLSSQPPQKRSEISVEEGFRELIRGAIREALEEGFADMMKQFDVHDGLEKDLWIRAMSDDKGSAVPETMSIVLFRPDRSRESRQSYEKRFEDTKATFRFVRVRTAKVSVPIAVVVVSSSEKDRAAVLEATYQYTQKIRGGEWSPLQ
jgi:hypothetical protein